MGDRMIHPQPIADDAVAPPHAPLAMPKQVLVPQTGALAAIVARLALLKHSFRRIG